MKWGKLQLARGFSPALIAVLASAQHHQLEELVDNAQWHIANRLAGQSLKSAGANDAKLYWLAARVRFAYHDLDQAAGLTEKAVALDPGNADYQFLLFEIYGSQAAEASIFRQPGLARKCKKAVDTAVALNPKHVEALIGLMQYLHRAPALFGGDKKRAYSIPREIAAFNPAEGHLAQAQLDLLEKRPDLARESYRKAVAADPNLHRARVLLARSLFSQNPAQAESEARQAVRIKPKRMDGWNALTYALGRQGKQAEVEESTRQMDGVLGFFHGARGWVDGGHDTEVAERWLRLYRQQPGQGPECPTAAEAERILKELKKSKS